MAFNALNVLTFLKQEWVRQSVSLSHSTLYSLLDFSRFLHITGLIYHIDEIDYPLVQSEKVQREEAFPKIIHNTISTASSKRESAIYGPV